MKSKINYYIIIILLFILTGYIFQVLLNEKKITSTLKQNFFIYQEQTKILFQNENKKISEVTLTNVEGKLYDLNDIYKKHNGPILVVYFPKCICNVEQDYYLNEIKELNKKGIINKLIIVFNEINYHKAMALKRVNKFSCDLYCDRFSKLNLINNKYNEIFTFILDSDISYKNVIFPKLIKKDNLAEYYNNYN